jgi:hypothetical protein
MSPLKLFIIVLLFAVSINLNAQLHLFGGAGVSYYQGDMYGTVFPTLKTTCFSWKAGVSYDFHRSWGVRAHYSKAEAHGSDLYSSEASSLARGVTFTTKITDIGLTAKYKHLFKKSYRLMNYGFFGFDYMSMLVSRTPGNDPVVPEDGYSPTQFNIPIGIGVGWWFDAHWGAVAESSYHYTFTDYLDGISNAGNPKANDSYIDLHVMLVYRFGGRKTGDGLYDPSDLNNVDCPKWGY